MASLIAQSLRALPSALLRRAPAALSSTRTLACSAALRKENVPVTVAFGDGIGPEITESTLRILDAAGAPLDYEEIKIGEQVYLKGISSGIEESGWDSLERTKLFLKAPITTPLGGGVKSLNVTVRKTLGLYANVRPVMSYWPYVTSLHPKIDMVIVRENEEDCYAGIEHQHTSEVAQCIKLISVPGTARVCKFAMDYAEQHGRKKVTCVTKSNIMKLTDGMFQRVFTDVAKLYPNIKTEHRIVDIATAQVASKPQSYDVIVTLNLYGDIISDVAAEVAGSVGLCGSANIGTAASMFEAVHGSAPDIAGQNMANPSGMLNGAVMMLGHINEHEIAAKIKNAWLCALEEGLHTADIYRPDLKSTKLMGTREFTDAVIERLGQEPKHLKVEKPAEVIQTRKFEIPEYITSPRVHKDLVGVDFFVDWDAPDRDPEVLAEMLLRAETRLKLKMISNRGVKVWPSGNKNTNKVNHWRCRFVREHPAIHVENSLIHEMMKKMNLEGLDVIKTENLYNYNGESGYSMGQGQ